MKKHWVEFQATIYGSILVEGDSNPKSASEYVKKHIGFSCDTEGNEAEISDFDVDIISSIEEAEGEG